MKIYELRRRITSEYGEPTERNNDYLLWVVGYEDGGELTIKSEKEDIKIEYRDRHGIWSFRCDIDTHGLTVDEIMRQIKGEFLNAEGQSNESKTKVINDKEQLQILEDELMEYMRETIVNLITYNRTTLDALEVLRISYGGGWHNDPEGTLTLLLLEDDTEDEEEITLKILFEKHGDKVIIKDVIRDEFDYKCTNCHEFLHVNGSKNIDGDYFVSLVCLECGNRAYAEPKQ